MFNDTFLSLYRSSSFSLNITMQTPTKFLRVPFGGKWQEIFLSGQILVKTVQTYRLRDKSDFSRSRSKFFNDDGKIPLWQI